jgi:hypothetical protein
MPNSLNMQNCFYETGLRCFAKMLGICMTADSNGHHAYFPALITCIAFLDFLSGLYAGKLKGHNIVDLIRYANKFMDRNRYRHIDLLYIMFCHKIAHIAYPYIVFDTSTDNYLSSQRHRRITWTVYASRRTQPIELIDFSSPRSDLKTIVPWPVTYDSGMLISIRSFQTDVIKSIS